MKSILLLQKEFNADQIQVCNESHSNRQIDSVIEQRIEELWAVQQKQALEKGMVLYDSEVYRLNGFSVENHILNLKIATASYRQHAAMKQLTSENVISQSALDKTLVVDALLRTSDRKYVFGSVKKVVETTTYLIGATCSKSRTLIQSGQDLFLFTKTAVIQRLNLSEKIVSTGNLVGLLQNGVGSVHAIIDVDVQLPSRELMTLFKPSHGIVDLVIIEESDLKEFLAKGDGYLPALSKLAH